MRERLRVHCADDDGARSMPPKKQKRERQVEREMEYEEVGGDAFDDAEEAPPASSSAPTPSR